jgi:hypothetical protein
MTDTEKNAAICGKILKYLYKNGEKKISSRFGKGHIQENVEKLKEIWK